MIRTTLYTYIIKNKLCEIKGCYGIWKFEEKKKRLIPNNEEWKELHIENIESVKVSNHGNVKHMNNKYYNQTKTKQGYIEVNIRYKSEKKYKHFHVHQLVLLAFQGKKENHIPNHKNGKKDDNKLENLEYATSKENTQHAVNTGLLDYSKSKRCAKIIQYDKNLKEINRFNSVTEAAKTLNLGRTNISEVCRSNKKKTNDNGKHTSGGFIWRYEDDPIDIDKPETINGLIQ